VDDSEPRQLLQSGRGCWISGPRTWQNEKEWLTKTKVKLFTFK